MLFFVSLENFANDSAYDFHASSIAFECVANGFVVASLTLKILLASWAQLLDLGVNCENFSQLFLVLLDLGVDKSESSFWSIILLLFWVSSEIVSSWWIFLILEGFLISWWEFVLY